MVPSNYPFSETIYNDYLDIEKEIKGKTCMEVHQKSKTQISTWEKREKTLREKNRLEEMKFKAGELTQKDQETISNYQNIVISCHDNKSKFNWDSLVDNREFKPFVFNDPPPDLLKAKSETYIPEKNWLLEILFDSFRKRREDAEELFRQKVINISRAYEEKKSKAETEYKRQKDVFVSKQKKHNELVKQQQRAYESGDRLEIEKLISHILKVSKYPKGFKKLFEVIFDSNEKTIVINYDLPNPSQVPIISAHKYIASRKCIEAIPMKKKDQESFYDSVLIQVCLRTVYETFKSDYMGHIINVGFNGWVNDVDIRTGKDFRSCVYS